MKIGIDVMGGDHAPVAIVEGAVLAFAELPKSVQIVLIGDNDIIEPLLKSKGADPANFEIIHTKDVIGMGDNPTKGFTQKPNASIPLGFKMLKEKTIDAFASCGNTGAMLVGCMFTIKTIPGIIRPCIASILPKYKGGAGVLLDVGANADCKPDVLYQFGILGSLYLQHVYGMKSPRVGLLNIGEEEEKGNLVSQSTFTLMKGSKDFNFIGNVEGHDLFGDKADVVVCDGFNGNVVLKTCESLYHIMHERGIKDEYFDRFNYESYGGLPIMGINSNVMIGHGISSAVAVKNLINLAKNVTEAKLNERVKEAFEQFVSPTYSG